MSYMTVADIADSTSLSRRVTACAAKEHIEGPESWANFNRWKWAAEPGWEEAWDYAVATGAEDPGAVEGAITDGMILAAVQRIHDVDITPHEDV